MRFKNIIYYKGKINNINTCLVISSTKKYSYIWEPFFIMLFKYWENITVDIYFISDGSCKFLNKKFDIHVFEAKRDIGFMKGYLLILSGLKEKYNSAILMQEDFIVQRKVNNELLLKYFDILKENQNIGYIRLMPCPGPEGKEYIINNVKFKEINKNSEYSFSFQATIWNINFFLESSKRYTNSIWALEGYLSKKLTRFKDILLLGFVRPNKHIDAVLEAPIPYRPTAIVRGKLQDWAKKLLEENGIKI